LSSSSDAVFISSIVANLRPFMGLFSFGNRKQSQGAKSGEYGVVIDQQAMMCELSHYRGAITMT
jgi:hypothetical protein